MSDLIINIIVSLFTGVVTGFACGFIIARMTRFQNLQSEAIRILRGWHYIEVGNDGVEIKGVHPDTVLLQNIAGDFYFLRHEKAGEDINCAVTILNGIINPSSYKEVKGIDSEIQKISRELKPNVLSVLGLNLKA